MLSVMWLVLLSTKGHLPVDGIHEKGDKGTADNNNAGGFRSIVHYVTREMMVASQQGVVNTFDSKHNFHGQVGQDRTIALLSREKRGGFFVDLAANDPIIFSNSRALERDYQWNGICIDGNQAMLDKLVAQRMCSVVKGIVSRTSGATVRFTSSSGSREHVFGGILSNTTDNKIVRPRWHSTTETTVTLLDILDYVSAPNVIDYLSLDIEGAEYDALAAFNFSKYRFNYLTIERPPAILRAMLREHGYAYLIDHGCFGDQLWAHSSLAQEAARALNITLSAADRTTCDEGEVLWGPVSKSSPLRLHRHRCTHATGLPTGPTPVECCGIMEQTEKIKCKATRAAGASSIH